MEWVVDGKIDTNYVMQKGCDGREEDLALIAKHGTLRGSFFFRDRVCRGDVRGDECCSGTGRNLGNPKGEWGGPLVVVTSEAYYTELLLVQWSR